MLVQVGSFSLVKRRTSTGRSTNWASTSKPKTTTRTIIIIGNEPKGLWKKAFGLAKAEELMKIVEDVINDR